MAASSCCAQSASPPASTATQRCRHAAVPWTWMAATIPAAAAIVAAARKRAWQGGGPRSSAHAALAPALLGSQQTMWRPSCRVGAMRGGACVHTVRAAACMQAQRARPCMQQLACVEHPPCRGLPPHPCCCLWGPQACFARATWGPRTQPASRQTCGQPLRSSTRFWLAPMQPSVAASEFLVTYAVSRACPHVCPGQQPACEPRMRVPLTGMRLLAAAPCAAEQRPPQPTPRVNCLP